MQLLSFETAAWGSPLPSQVGQRIPQHSRHGEATRLLCPYPCMVLPQESAVFPPISDFSLPFPPGCRHSPTALMCSCSSYKTSSSAWGSPSCCLHLTHWFRGIWSIKKTPQKQNTNSSLCQCTKCAVRSVPKGSNILPLNCRSIQIIISTQSLLFFFFVPQEQGFPIANFSSGGSPDRCLKSIHRLKDTGSYSLL